MATPVETPLPDLSETKVPSLYAGAIITYILASTAVVLRFVARRITRSKLWWDDWLIVVAWCSITAFFIIEFVWIHLGLGVHYQIIAKPYLEIEKDMFLLLFIEDLFYSTSTVFLKLSLLAFYWRIFKVANIRWPVRILVTAIICWLIARYVAIILHCIPVAAYWDKTIQNAHCGVNDRLFFMGTNTVNFIIDLTILILPMPFIKRLQVRRAQKLSVFGMFTLGGFIVAVSIVLLVVCYTLDNTSPDVTWTLSPVVLWAGTEINLGVVTACLPSLRPIFFYKKDNQSSSIDAQYHASHGLSGKTGMTFGSRGRTVKTFSGLDSQDKYHPFDKGNDRNTMLERPSHSEPTSNDSNIDLEDISPPYDKVLVREDISVNYSRM